MKHIHLQQLLPLVPAASVLTWLPQVLVSAAAHLLAVLSTATLVLVVPWRGQVMLLVLLLASSCEVAAAVVLLVLAIASAQANPALLLLALQLLLLLLKPRPMSVTALAAFKAAAAATTVHTLFLAARDTAPCLSLGRTRILARLVQHRVILQHNMPV